MRYLSEHQMQVKFNCEESEIMSLIGGGPQGTILGQLIAAFLAPF